MSKLMEELMAEVQRINALEVEVDRTIERQKNQVQQERKEKVKSIGIFLNEMCDALIEADAMRMPNKAPTYILLYSVDYDDDGYKRTAGITFFTDNIYSGGYFIGSNDCSKTETFQSASITGGYSKSMRAIIDAWSPKLEEDIENAIAKYIKIVLAKRTEKMKAELQKSNDEYARYRKE